MEKRLIALTTEVSKRVIKTLKIHQNFDVVIYPTLATDAPLLVSGITPNQHCVHLEVDVSFGMLEVGAPWENDFRTVLAHELHHLKRWTGPGFGNTIRETLVSEGLAAHFEQEIFPEIPVPDFYLKLPKKRLYDLWLKWRPYLDKNLDYAQWFMGKSRVIPTYVRYPLAYALTSNLTSKPSQLVLKEAKDIPLDL